MPTPRNVLGVSSRQAKPQCRATARRARGVARGTTLHNAAPSKGARPANLKTSLAALPLNQAAVGIFACFTTRFEFASPKWVFVFPMSKSRIIYFPASHLLPRFVRDGRDRCAAARRRLRSATQRDRGFGERPCGWPPGGPAWRSASPTLRRRRQNDQSKRARNHGPARAGSPPPARAAKPVCPTLLSARWPVCAPRAENPRGLDSLPPPCRE